MAEVRAMEQKRALREGFTTGTASAAAAKAATLALLGAPVDRIVDTPLPGGDRLNIPLESWTVEKDQGMAAVRKDGGDDPDVTHGALISARVGRLDPRLVSRPDGSDADQVLLAAGPGVGTVTLPGLPVAVGQPAINPGPREQITAAVLEAVRAAGLIGQCAWRVEISVERGQELAQKTMNPRLGIVGGISILGTRGTVKPYSHEAWQAAVAQSLDVARAAGLDTACLATGRRSERMLMEFFPQLPEIAFVQAADYYAFSLAQAAAKGFARIIQGAFFGKLIKMAQGFSDTHVRAGHADMAALAARCRELGLDAATAREIAGANTGMQAQDFLLSNKGSAAVLDGLVADALATSRRHAGPGPQLTLVLLHMDGRELARRSDPPLRGED